MPFKSEAQKKKFQQLVSDGKMDQATYDQWDKETLGPLPERVSPKPVQNPFTKMTRLAGRVKEIK